MKALVDAVGPAGIAIVIVAILAVMAAPWIKRTVRRWRLGRELRSYGLGRDAHRHDRQTELERLQRGRF